MTNSEKKHLQEIFHQSQFSLTSHEKLTKQLKQFYEKIPLNAFVNEFTNCLKVPLIHGEKHRAVENTLNFAAKFIASLLQAKPVTPNETDAEDEDEEMCPFVVDVLKFLFENHNTENQAIRFRVCQFINKVLNGLGNEACIDDNLCDQISECMMERLQDKAPAVRMQAVMALHRLQDPTDVKCPVMKAFMFHMSADPSADVRRAVITNIAITAQSVRSMLERTHDLKDSVRRTAYMSLSKLGVARFTINQRVRLLTDGLKDHSALVRECVSKIMLPAWLQFYKGSYLSLLHALDCENSTEISSLVLQALFKCEPIKNVLEELTKLLNEDKVIPVDELSPENVLYWRVLTEYLEAHPEIADDRPIDEPLPEILPELSTFCNYIRQFFEVKSVEEAEDWVKLQHQYILIQLLELSKGFDLADEMGRTNLRNLCLHLLTSSAVSEDLVPVVVEIMVRVVPDVEDRLQALAEAISEVREPMTEQEQPEPDPSTCLSAGEARQRELKQASIRVKINELKEEQDDAIRDQDFIRAQKLKEEFEQLQVELKALTEAPACPSPPVSRTEVRDVEKDHAALCKCLRIVREMVQSDKVKCLSATLRSLMQNFVLPCLQEQNTHTIRNKALEVLGLFSLLDKALAQENFVMFCFQIANDDVCEVALKVTFDLLLLYGLETFQIQEENGETSTKKKKKKNLFVTEMYDDEFDTEEEENQESQTNISSGSSGNTSNLISMLTSLLDSASTSMRNLAMEGLYKLLMACRITSSALLSRLILMWYSPVTEGDETLRQPLGVFLNVYASHCPRSQETLEQSFLPTLRTLMQAPVTSPLTQIDQDSVALLFTSLTRPGVNKFHSKTSHIHNNMAISICNEIMDCGDDSTNISVLLRALSQLELSVEDSVYRQELTTLIKNVQQIFRSTKEKRFLRCIDKFSELIENATENVTMRTEEVDNTAATSQLEGTQCTNNSHVSDVQTSRKGNKIDRILNPHMHTLIAENEGEDEDDEDEENSQKSCSIISNIVIPASPPRSQSTDGDEDGDDDVFEATTDSIATGSKGGSKQQKSASYGDDDDVFKHPPEPKKRANNKVPRRGSARDQVRSLSSDSDSVSPVAKRRKAADGGKAKERSTQTPSKPDSPTPQGRRKTVKNQKEEQTNKQVPGQKSKTVAPVRTSPKKNVRGVGKQDQPSSVQETTSSKRQINPTEKGASLKTFQNISPNSRSVLSPSSIEKAPSTKPPARKIRKVAEKGSSISGNDTDSSTAAHVSTSNSVSPGKTPSIQSKSRRSVTFKDNNQSLDSPLSSAAELQRTKKGIRNQGLTRSSSNEKSSDSDFQSSPSKRLGSRQAHESSSNATQKNSVQVTKSSSGPDEADSDSSPAPTRQGRLRTKVDAKISPGRKRVVSSAKASSSEVDSDASPLPPSRSGRGRNNRMQEKRSPQPSKALLAEKAEDSSLPSRRRGRSKSQDEESSPGEAAMPEKGHIRSSKTSSSDIDSDTPPGPVLLHSHRHVKGIEKLSSETSGNMRVRTLRKSISSSDAERTPPRNAISSPDPKKIPPSEYPKTRRSAASFDKEAQSPSPMSAAELKRTQKKIPTISDSDTSPSPSLRLSARRNNRVNGVETQSSKKRPANALKSSSSDSFEGDSNSPGPFSGHGRNRHGANQRSNESSPSHPVKKMRTKTPSKDSPLSEVSRRSLRSESTPSPRTRSGKV